jgi:hypothetical protein
MSEVVLVSHPNKSFEGTRDLYTATDGFLLAITKVRNHCLQPQRAFARKDGRTT